MSFSVSVSRFERRRTCSSTSGREVLRLVDQQHDVAAGGAGLEEEAVQRVDQALLASRPRGFTCRSSRIGAQELGRGERGVEHDRGVGVGAELREEVARERRLAGAHLAGDEDEAAALAPAELEVGEGLRVPLGQVQVLRVRREVEGLLAEAVPGLVHGRVPPRCAARPSVPPAPRDAGWTPARGMLCAAMDGDCALPGADGTASLHGRGEHRRRPRPRGRAATAATPMLRRAGRGAGRLGTRRAPLQLPLRREGPAPAGPSRRVLEADDPRRGRARARTRPARSRIVHGGRSMGGRIASQVVAAGEPADGLAFLGYPLHPPGQPEKLRDAHLPADRGAAALRAGHARRVRAGGPAAAR